jgi:BirA family biotin operon repressor/biotin-[acetyl-CoA-carboxylase] ligase
MNTLFIGRRLIRLKSVDSTNNFAASLSLSDAPEGTFILADEQTSGKGQFGKIWHAQKGMNLTATVVLRPVFLSPEKLSYLNKAVAISVCQTVQTYLKSATTAIKWPNDIFVDNFKLAGILTENTVRGSQIVSYLAGIGINVNQDSFDENAPNASSIYKITESKTDLDKLVETLCKHLEANYLKLRANDLTGIDLIYHSLLYKKGEWLDFNVDDNLIRAKIIKVDSLGSLIIETQNGEALSFRNGEVQYLIPKI